MVGSADCLCHLDCNGGIVRAARRAPQATEEQHGTLPGTGGAAGGAPV